MKSKYINIDLEIETPELDIVEYSIHARIDYFIDNSYGADADGNRGTTVTFVEDVEIIEITENGKPITLSEENDLIVKAKIEERFLEGSIEC